MPFPGSSDLWGGGRSSLNQEREQSQTFPTPHLPQGDSSDCHCLLLGSVFCPGYVWVTFVCASKASPLWRIPSRPSALSHFLL
jgi:hypothetical protein